MCRNHPAEQTADLTAKVLAAGVQREQEEGLEIQP